MRCLCCRQPVLPVTDVLCKPCRRHGLLNGALADLEAGRLVEA